MQTQHLSITSQLIILCSLITILGCNKKKDIVKHPKTEEQVNVLLQEWTGPYGGTPAFDKLNVADIKPALEKGIELHLQDIEAITATKEAPTLKIRLFP